MFKFLIIAGLPILALFLYLNKQDKIKPEPRKKLLACFGLGIAGGICEGLIICILDWLGLGSSNDSILYSDVLSRVLSDAVCVLISYLILWQYSKRNSDFDEFFDGPVYATFIMFGSIVINDLFSISSDEWYYVGYISIFCIVATYGAALYIGYFYALAHFGKLEMNGSRNKFKMFLYPFLVLLFYDLGAYLGNFSIIGFILVLVAYGFLTYFVYKKNNELLGKLRALDAEMVQEKELSLEENKTEE